MNNYFSFQKTLQLSGILLSVPSLSTMLFKSPWGPVVHSTVINVVFLVLNEHCTLLSFRDYLKEWQNKGLSVVLWTVNNSAEKDYFSRVLKCPIMTDNVRGDSEQNTP